MCSLLFFHQKSKLHISLSRVLCAITVKIRERNQKRPKYKKLNLEEMARRLTFVM